MAYPILVPSNTESDLNAARRSQCALVVMAKTPRAGKVKTRLAPPLTPQEAAELNICFLRDTTENLNGICDAVAVGDAPRAAGLISYTPAGDEVAFDGLLPPGFSLVLQRGNGFGERLLAAAEDILALGFGSVCLIDSDSPTVPRAAFEQAIEALARPGDRVVLGPTDDGGYYLIGLKQAHAAPFERIAWSTATVFAETCQRVQEVELELVTLPLWYDVDDAVTLAVLRKELIEGRRPELAAIDGYAAPHTSRFLREQLVSDDDAGRSVVAPQFTGFALRGGRDE